MDALAQLKSSLTGRYAIEREIGRGGMATVYLARDVRHNRHVALKLLNPELGAVLGVERFLSEIQVTANLQHPNLLPLFDSGEAEGLLFYVMPYVDGESLRAKIEREKQLPIHEAIHIGGAVASALDYAHRRGVIHRDLKPENILVHEGEPMVADFGIALAVSNAGGNRITQTGLSLGTPQYMSPEQATGDRIVDGRTDVYSLGAVVYEMLTGEPPHSGTTAQAIIAKVITDRPRSIRLSRETVPHHVENAVDRALAKLPADRFHTAHEFADALQGRLAAIALPNGFRTPGTVEPYTAARKWRELLDRRVAALLTAAFVVGGALIGLMMWRFATPSTQAAAVTFTIEPPTPNGVPEPIGIAQISPNGRLVAFVAWSDAASQIYVRRLDDLDVRPLPGTKGAVNFAFSPDGKWLCFVTLDGKLTKVLLDGTSMVTVANGVIFWGGLAWDSDSTILFGVATVAQNGIARVSAKGGTPRVLTKPTNPEAGWEHGRPVVASDGETLLFSVWGPGHLEDDFLGIGSLKTGEFTRTSLLSAGPIGVVDERILYWNTAGSLMAVAFDARTRRLTGDPVRVMEGLAIGIPAAHLSRQGTLTYRRGQTAQRLLLVDSAGANPRRLSEDERNFLFDSEWGTRPTFSPDGRRVAVVVGAQRAESFATDIWTFNVVSRAFTRLTSLGNVAGPEWTPDAKHLVFTTWENRNPTIWRQVADGSEPPEKLFELPDGNAFFGANATPDGRGVVYCQFSSSTGSTDLFYLPFNGDRTPQKVSVGPFQPMECAGRVSPDEKLLAYVASDGERSNVSVSPFRGTGGRLQVSPDGGDSPLWSRDGKRLYYSHTEAGRTSLFVADVKLTGSGLDVANRKRLLTLGEGGKYDIAPNGKDILMFERGDSRVQLVVTTNWISQLRARLAGSK